MRYRDAGVSLDRQDQFIGLIKKLNRKSGHQIGAFAALFDLKKTLKNYEHPLLVSSTDGIGTKTRLAVEYGSVGGLGQDLVAMSVNDIATIGAKPLFFLDYYGTAEIDLCVGEAFVQELVKACEEANCELIGGETSQLRDLYRNVSDLELVGFVVGIVEQSAIPDSKKIRPGDCLIGLLSSGPHCNGYSLIRKIVSERKLDLRKIYSEAGTRLLGELLLEPMRIYSNLALKLFSRFEIKGAAHITGSGILGNLPRVLNSKVDAAIDTTVWPRLKIFAALQRWGEIPEDEMWDVFNMGIGFIFIVSDAQADQVLHFLKKQGEQAHLVGKIERGKGRVRLQQ
ncbi:phosphoribosylformylglycinamidine cyclo-ligase [Candidatus Acetothermia bacterium]|nr:phosphoribosylformylglycinamidine cyclo-ligase [Candidatus Acetothermia bacterium]